MDLVVVPAGGASRRLGRDKLAVDVDGTTVLDRLLDGLAGAAPGVPVVVVGPRRATVHEVVWRREDPPGGGPVAALATALDDATAAATSGSGLAAVIAGDLPFGADALPALQDAAEQTDADAWLAVDEDGVVQPLLGIYRRAALVGRFGDGGAGRSVRSLLTELHVRSVVVPPRALLDVDVEEDVTAVRAAVRRPPARRPEFARCRLNRRD